MKTKAIEATPQLTSIPFKAIIGGQRWDTSKCKHLGDAKRTMYFTAYAKPIIGDSKDERTRHNVITASLYLTPNGQYFCVSGDGRVGSESWYPMSKEDALEWAETELSVDEMESLFGDIITDA
jgi:hypothetical protein